MRVEPLVDSGEELSVVSLVIQKMVGAQLRPVKEQYPHNVVRPDQDGVVLPEEETLAPRF